MKLVSFMRVMLRSNIEQSKQVTLHCVTETPPETPENQPESR